MTSQGPDRTEPAPDDSWSSSLTGSSLGDSSLDDGREAAARDLGAPNPFSREAAPGEALGADGGPPADPATAGSTPEPGPSIAADPPSPAWPVYPAASPTASDGAPSPYGGAAATPSYGYDSGADGYQGSSGYGSGAQPYGQAPSYGQAPGYGQAPSYEQTSPAYGAPDGYPQTPAYGAPHGYPQTPAYGTNPYEVNPYQTAYGGSSPYGLVPQPHPQATVALILGLVGMVVCPLVGIAGLAVGSRARKEIDAQPQRYTGRGMATAGVVLGIISIVVAVLWVVFFALGVSGAFDS